MEQPTDTVVSPPFPVMCDGRPTSETTSPWHGVGALRAHRAPIPEEEPLPGEEPAPEDEPLPHPDPVVREPDAAPSVRLFEMSANHFRT